jgi:hypothetical protein
MNGRSASSVEWACHETLARVESDSEDPTSHATGFTNLGSFLFWLGALAESNGRAREPLLTGLSWARDQMATGRTMTELAPSTHSGGSPAVGVPAFFPPLIWCHIPARNDGAPLAADEALQALAEDLYRSYVAGLTVPGPLIAGLALARTKP